MLDWQVCQICYPLEIKLLLLLLFIILTSIFGKQGIKHRKPTGYGVHKPALFYWVIKQQPASYMYNISMYDSTCYTLKHRT